LRAKIILMADKDMKHQEIARKLDVNNNNVITDWTARWKVSSKPAIILWGRWVICFSHNA
jgi:hypothetical protein